MVLENDALGLNRPNAN